MAHHTLAILGLSLGFCLKLVVMSALTAACAAETSPDAATHTPAGLPADWDPVLAGDAVLRRLVRVTAPQVKGAHDAEFVCVGDRAYVVAEVNDTQAGESAAWPEVYCTLSIVSLDPPALEKVVPFARSEQPFANATLPQGACFVPRIIQKDSDTLRCYFASEHPGHRQSQTWYRDFNLQTGSFHDTIHPAKLVTAAGLVDMEPRHLHADAAARGFRKPARDFGLYLFDSFKTFDGRTYVALNNFPGQQNALALVRDDLATFEVLGHYNEPQSAALSESAVNRLPDGTWMAICRNDRGTYRFTTSRDGRTWTAGEELPSVLNGANSKPTFDRFGDTYYLGWQEATRINGVSRSVFNVDVSRDGKHWKRKYRFETPQSFQYPTFHEHAGTIWLSVTQGDHSASRKERIMFGTLEAVGEFEPQNDLSRIEWPAPPSPPSDGAAVRPIDPLAPSVIVSPGPEFQDDARPGAMIIGMDRTPRGRIWGCWTATGDKPDGCFLLATSDDGGTTWSRPRLAVGARPDAIQKRHGALVGNLWTDPDGFEAPDGLIHILYDWNRHTDAEILLATFREADVLAGRPVSPDTTLRRRVTKATGPKPEKLTNGIELPDIWPPRFGDPASAEPMDVPYLRSPPRVISIDVGRQLFVDDFLIASTDLERVFHRPEKFTGNPVFTAKTPRELTGAVEGRVAQQATVYTGHGGLFFDPDDKVFKLFYTAGWRGPLALATSADLVHWTRPDLGLAGDNALLPAGGRWTGPTLQSSGSDNCVWLDVTARDPAERIKFLTCWMHVPKEQRPHGFNHTLHVSDGRTWSAGRPTGLAEDYCSFFFNPFRNVWVFSIKQGGPRGRCRWYAEHPNFLTGADWSKAVYWTNADRLDSPEPEGGYPGAGEPTQLYSLSAVAYESVMLGMHMILRGPRNDICDRGGFPKLSDLHLGFSRDGFHWDRPDRRPFIPAARTEGTWDRAYVHPTTGVLVILKDRLVFPYCGFSGIAPDGGRGMYTGGSVGLATLRRDGFASMDGPGVLTTRRLRFSGEHLFVNVDGRLKVEVLDEAGGVLAVSAAVEADATRHRVVWAGPGERHDLADLRNRPVRFRFTLPEGRLYAFWMSADSSGASGGYVGAGGPGYVGVRDDAVVPASAVDGTVIESRQRPGDSGMNTSGGRP